MRFNHHSSQFIKSANGHSILTGSKGHGIDHSYNVGDVPLSRQRTQADQDNVDDATRRAVLRDLVESWMDRLKLISVITTFFASTEAGLISVITRDAIVDYKSHLEDVSSAALLGSLVVHSSAAIISFTAAFFLVRYKLKSARTEEHEGGEVAKDPHAPKTYSNAENAKSRSIRTLIHKFNEVHKTDPVPGRIRTDAGGPESHPVWSSNPHLVQVGPFSGQPPTHLLERCHILCIFLTVFGFILAVLGIVFFAWARHPQSSSIFMTICIGICIVFGVGILVVPAGSGEMKSSTYSD